MLQAVMDVPTRRRNPLASPILPAWPSKPHSDSSASHPSSSQCSPRSSFLTSNDCNFVTQTPRSVSAHSRVSLLVQSTHSSSQAPPNSNINFQDLNLLHSPASSHSPLSSKRTSCSSHPSFLTSSKMSSVDYVIGADNNTLAPLSLGNLHHSDQVFGSSPSVHSQPHRTSFSGASLSSARPEQDAFGYRNLGPAIVLKTYRSKHSTLDWASRTSTKLEGSTQPGDSDQYGLREPFTYSTDLIYEELNLTDPDQFHADDGKQMNLQFDQDQDSLDTQVEQSYRTAVTTTLGPALAHADQSFQYSEVEATELKNQSKQISHLDLLTGDMVPSVQTKAHIDEKNIHSISSLTDTSLEPVYHVKSTMSHAQGYNTLPDNTSETSRKNSTQVVASKSDDQVTIESTVIQSSRLSSDTISSACPLAHEIRAANLTLDKPGCPSKPTFAVDDVKPSVNAPAVNSLPEAPVSASLLVVVADNEPVSTRLSPGGEEKGERTTGTGRDLEIHASKRAGPPEPSEPTSPAQAVPAVQPLPFPEINGAEKNTASAPAKEQASVSTLPEVPYPVSKENVVPEAGKKNVIPESKENLIPESGKDTTSNDATPKHDISTPMSSKQTSRMRSISEFIKTLNKRSDMKADALDNPSSGLFKSKEEEKNPPAIKALLKRKSLSSLKVKTRFSSFYRSTHEPVPEIPKSPEPPRVSEGREVVLKVEGTTTPLKKASTKSPSTPQDKQQPSQGAVNQVISAPDVKARRFTQPYKTSRAKQGLKSRSQTITPCNTSPIDNLEKPFTTVVGELGRTPFSRPNTLRKRRTFHPQVSTPVLKDITLSAFISKLMRKNTQKDGVA